MAFSQSIEKAQNPALCQFCEESNIKWKCINCDLFLCQLCNSRIHSKIKSSDKHEVLNLKECGTEDAAATIRKVDLHNMPCTIHSEQKCFVYCNTNECKYIICSDCLTESHQNHEFKKVKEVYDSIISEFSALKGKIETDIKWHESEKAKYEQLLLDGDKNFQETRDEIIQTEKEMKETISRYARDLILELETKWRPLEDKIKTELSTITLNKDDLVLRKGILDTTLLSHQSSDIFSTSKTMDFKLPNKADTADTEIDLKETKFIPGLNLKKFESQINAEFGNLYTIPDLEVLKNYQFDKHPVTSIQHCDNNTAFIACFNEKLTAVKFEDDNLKVQKEFEIEVVDMAIQHNGDLIISCWENDLKLYNDDEVKIFKSFSPLNTAGVHVNKDNQTLVGLIDADNSSADGVSKVIVINQRGDIQHTYEFDKDNQRLFTLPWKIKSINDKILIVDRTCINKNLKGQVLALDYGGQIQWTYKGCGSVNTDETDFTPVDIAVSSNDMIVVSDVRNHALHILSPTGEIILCKDTEHLGIVHPFSLDFDREGILWIGCLGTDKTKASICALKLV